MHDTNLLEDQPIAWTPTPEVVERAQLTRFMKQVGVSTWDELYEFSIRDVEKFTEEVLKFLDIKFDPPYEKLLDTTNGVEIPVWFRSGDTVVPNEPGGRTDPLGGGTADGDKSAQWFRRSGDTLVPNEPEGRTDAHGGGTVDGDKSVQWFRRSGDIPVPNEPGGRTDPLGGGTADGDKSVPAPVLASTAGLNITEMCLDRWQTDEMKDQPAVIWEDETGDPVTYSYRELLDEVRGITAGLRRAGLRSGDAIGIHMPMIPETIVALMAIGSIGGIAVPVFSGYGAAAISARMNAVGAKALFTSEGFSRRGKFFDASEIALAAVRTVPSIKHVFTVGSPLHCPYEDDEATPAYDPEKGIGNFFELHQLGLDSDEKLGSIEMTDAEDPLIILYTSGTTGKPKGIAHTHASFPIKAAQDMAFGTDVGRGTRICWYTDIGWMMGPWLIYGALINGATICIYDGAPDYPTPDRMWEFCAKHKVEVLGISPTLVRALAANEDRSGDTLVPIGGSSAERVGSPSGLIGERSVPAPPRKGWSLGGKLPHFDGDVNQFITFRLADSLPPGVVAQLKKELEEADDGGERYRKRVEEYLDNGTGECILNDPAVAEIVVDALLNEDGRSCNLKAWVVMPNHAHVLLRMRPGHDLAGFMKRVKGVSARRINQLLGRDGPVWQKDYFDRYIRDGRHFSNVLRYIENNPVVAGLAATPGEWAFGSVAYRERDVAGGTGDGDKSVPAPMAPFERHDLSSLRAFASTGEPWNPAPWWWLFEKVGNSKLPIINYSGGTEVAGGILMGNPLLPIKPCSFPAPCPGMDVDILDEEGNSVGPGKVGELVIKQPWIGMARGFWQEKERYLDTYWRRFKDIWVHGDWAMRDTDGHWFILGRSDDTLKVAGKRVGPAEVESLLVAHPNVAEAAVIGVPDEVKGTAMVAFVVRSGDTPVPNEPKGRTDPLAGGTGDGDKSVPAPLLEAELKALVAKDMGKPLAPSKIHFVSALPKTRNAKVMRRVIRAAYLGEDAGDLSALEDPKAVEAIANAGK
jgi:acyl-coenzyme A synthetase/AMP-(fatty) acid ligase/REP element-mobilizing transposase RayT